MPRRRRKFKGECSHAHSFLVLRHLTQCTRCITAGALQFVRPQTHVGVTRTFTLQFCSSTTCVRRKAVKLCDAGNLHATLRNHNRCARHDHHVLAHARCGHSRRRFCCSYSRDGRPAPRAHDKIEVHFGPWLSCDARDSCVLRLVTAFLDRPEAATVTAASIYRLEASGRAGALGRRWAPGHNSGHTL